MRVLLKLDVTLTLAVPVLLELLVCDPEAVCKHERKHRHRRDMSDETPPRLVAVDSAGRLGAQPLTFVAVMDDVRVIVGVAVFDAVCRLGRR